MPPPIVPHIVSKFDTSNFANSKKKYEEEETKNPFFSKTDDGGDDSKNEPKNSAIKSETFELTRNDLLRQMNEEDILKIE